MVVPSSTVALVGLFLVGVVLVIWCVEIFIEAVAQSAVSLGVSGFFLAVVLAGVDLENAVLRITAAFVDLPGLALGTVFGESLFVLAVAVGLAGILVPFRMDVPRAYLVMLVLSFPSPRSRCRSAGRSARSRERPSSGCSSRCSPTSSGTSAAPNDVSALGGTPGSGRP